MCYTSKLLTPMMTYFRHYQCRKCRILSIIVASVTNIILSSYLCHVSNDIIRTLKTPSKTSLRKRNHLMKRKKNFPWRKPLKNDFWKEILPYPLSWIVSSPYPSLGERCNTLCTLLGEIWHVWENFGLLRKIRDKSPSTLELVGFESEVKAIF